MTTTEALEVIKSKTVKFVDSTLGVIIVTLSLFLDLTYFLQDRLRGEGKSTVTDMREIITKLADTQDLYAISLIKMNDRLEVLEKIEADRQGLIFSSSLGKEKT